MTIVRRNRIDRFLQLMVERGASDLHFSVSRPPMFRLNGEIDPLRYRIISNEDYVSMMQPIDSTIASFDVLRIMWLKKKTQSPRPL